jgi:hypothetical protein
MSAVSRPAVPKISEDAGPAEEAADVHDAAFGLMQAIFANRLVWARFPAAVTDGAKKLLKAYK